MQGQSNVMLSYVVSPISFFKPDTSRIALSIYTSQLSGI